MLIVGFSGGYSDKWSLWLASTCFIITETPSDDQLLQCNYPVLSYDDDGDVVYCRDNYRVLDTAG